MSTELSDPLFTLTGLSAGYSYYIRVGARVIDTLDAGAAAAKPEYVYSDVSDTVATFTDAEDALYEKDQALQLAKAVAEEKAQLEARLAAQAEQERARAEEATRQLEALELQRKQEAEDTKLKLSQLRAQAQAGELDKKRRQEAEKLAAKNARDAHLARVRGVFLLCMVA